MSSTDQMATRQDSQEAAGVADQRVVGPAGLRGILDPAASTPDAWAVTLNEGGRIFIPRGCLRDEEGGGYRVDLTADQVRALIEAAETHRDQDTHREGDDVERIVVPVVAERVEIEKRRVERDVHVRVQTAEREQTVDTPVMVEEVHVDRVVVDRPVDAMPDVRQEGDITIVPVMAEEIVVTKRLILKEELHIRRVRREETRQHTVTLREQTVDVEREEKND